MSRRFNSDLSKYLKNEQPPWEHQFAADCAKHVLPIIKSQWPELAPPVEKAIAAARAPAVDNPRAVVQDLALAMAPVRQDANNKPPTVGRGEGATAVSAVTAAAVAIAAQQIADSEDIAAQQIADSEDDECKWQKAKLQEYCEGSS